MKNSTKNPHEIYPLPNLEIKEQIQKERSRPSLIYIESMKTQSRYTFLFPVGAGARVEAYAKVSYLAYNIEDEDFDPDNSIDIDSIRFPITLSGEETEKTQEVFNVLQSFDCLFEIKIAACENAYYEHDKILSV